MVPWCVGNPCENCGQPTYGKYRTTCLRKKTETTPKLGDRVETLTKKLSIPTCSGCQKRKAALNKLSDWWRGET